MRWIEPRRVFIVLALVFGGLMLIIVPPFQAPDEQSHLLRAYQISEGQFLSHWRHDEGVANLPISLNDSYLPFSAARYNEETTSFAAIRNAMKIPLKPAVRGNYRMAMAHYAPTAYVPLALAVWIGRILFWPPIFILYAARVANLLTWTALSWCALRAAPGLGRPLFLLMLMPMSIFMAASASPDGLIDSLAFAIVGLAFGAAEQGSMTQILGWRWIFAFIILSAALALAKAAFLPLAGLILMLPPRRFGGAARYWIVLALLAVATIAPVVIWSRTTPGVNIVISFASSAVSSRKQFHYLLGHPWRALMLPLTTFQQHTMRISYTFVGALGTLNVQLSGFFVVLYLFALLVACRTNNHGRIPATAAPKRMIIVSALVVWASTEALLLLVYLIWTPVGASANEGLQGRYFIPIVAALFPLLVTAWRYVPTRFGSKWSEASKNLAAALLAVVGCSYALIMLYLHYYVSVNVGSL